MCDCGNSTYGKYFSKIGGQFGDRLENKINSFADSAKKRFKDWTGLGDYRIVYNSLINGSPSNSMLSTGTSGRGLIIKHKEYLGDIITHPTIIGGFNVNTFRVNPGNVMTFPWLNPIALQHDQYKPLGIIFEFVSTASETSTSASLGSVIMCTQYDVADPNPINKNQMLNTAYSSESKMSQDMAHGLECDPNELQQNLYYVSAYKTTVSDPREYDMANYYVATQGGSLPVNTIVGSLYVYYEFEFFKQIPYGGIPNKSMLYAEYQGSTSSAVPNQFQSFWANNIPTLVYGRDLGISTFGNNIYIPYYWQGTTFKISGILTNISGNSGAVVPSAYTATNCSMKTNPFQVTAGYFQSAPRDTAATVSSGFMWQLLCTIDSNISSTAQISFATTIGNFPASAPAGGAKLSLIFEVVPQTYNSLT